MSSIVNLSIFPELGKFPDTGAGCGAVSVTITCCVIVVVSLYTSIILGTLLLTSTPPLYYEMACEITYPVAEGITNLWLTMMNNLGGFLFLLVQMIPNVGELLQFLMSNVSYSMQNSQSSCMWLLNVTEHTCGRLCYHSRNLLYIFTFQISCYESDFKMFHNCHTMYCPW